MSLDLPFAHDGLCLRRLGENLRGGFQRSPRGWRIVLAPGGQMSCSPTVSARLCQTPLDAPTHIGITAANPSRGQATRFHSWITQRPGSNVYFQNNRPSRRERQYRIPVGPTPGRPVVILRRPPAIDQRRMIRRHDLHTSATDNLIPRTATPSIRRSATQGFSADGCVARDSRRTGSSDTTRPNV